MQGGSRVKTGESGRVSDYEAPCTSCQGIRYTVVGKQRDTLKNLNQEVIYQVCFEK